MSLTLGIDLGTSGVKSMLVDEHDRIVAEASAAIPLLRPRPLWFEQEPQDWWQAVVTTLDTLAVSAPAEMTGVRAIGLSGQMLGVACIDALGHALRPAILGNDGRAIAECAAVEAAVPDFAGLVGSRAMAGFPAPKLLWLARHEPQLLGKAEHVLLPKDYIRLRLTGIAASDRADASATLLMDTLAGTWSPELLAACGVTIEQMPALIASDEIAGGLLPILAARWGMIAETPVIGGAGDTMCSAVSAGIVKAGMASISLDRSGVYFIASDAFLPARGRGLHTHRHAIEGLFAQNGSVLNAGAALSWIAQLVGADDVRALMQELEAAALPIDETPVFTPYLTGERTPHDDPALTGAFSGLTTETTRLHLVQAVLEGVAMAFADCHDALVSTGAAIRQAALIGEHANSRLWARLIASATGMPLSRSRTATVGPALGAARLARRGIGGPLIADGAEPEDELILPDASMAEALAAKKERFARHLALG